MLSRLVYGSVHQGLLENVLRNVFKGHNVITNARKDTKIKNPATGFYLEVDIWLPVLNLCFEFQDAYHYISAWDSHVPLSDIAKKDNFKKDKLLIHGATLILVPCWWDGTPESLVSSILFCRPDLRSFLVGFDPLDPPIPLNSELDYFKVKGVPEVGELMLASFPLSYQPGLLVDAENPWWVGEKYDGIRGVWQPKAEKIFTRSGREIFLPDFFYDLFPSKDFADGELWLGRGSFAESQLILAMDIRAVDWSMLRFMVFDNASPHMHVLPFEERYASLLDSVSIDQFLINAFRVWTTEKHNLNKMSEMILKEGGEGLILRLPRSPYISGRSSALFKIKASREDKEALVVEVAEDFIVLQQADGSTFKITKEASADKLINNFNIKQGDVVMFSYENISPRASPVNPQILRVREDLSWEEVLANESLLSSDSSASSSSSIFSSVSKSASSSLNAVSWNLLRAETKEASPETKRERREKLENFALERNQDPLVPEQWYSVSRLDVVQFKGARTMLHHYKGSLVKALLDLFPEIGLDESKFDSIYRNFWNVDNRRQAFVAFASDNKFDPYVANSWYSVTASQFQTNKSTSSILQLYDGNVVKALLHLFPEIGLRPSKFVLQPRKYWIDLENRREFIRFAKANDFDPLVAENWYPQTKENMLSMKGVSSILQYYGGSFVTALQQVFPDISFDPSLFVHLSNKLPEHKQAFSNSYWQKSSNRRSLFELIARDKGFDPLIPANWYSITTDDVLSYKGASSMLFYYAGSIVRALMELFPEVKFDRSQFMLVQNKRWVEESNKQKLQQFATSRGIDPLIPENWYRVISRTSIQSIPGVTTLLHQYRGSIVKALVHLFPQVQFDSTQFSHLPADHLARDYKRTFFEKFATKYGFDALVPDHWYNVSEQKIRESKTVHGIVEYYGHIGKALSKLFPEVQFDLQRFKTSHAPTKDLDTINKAILLRCAKDNGFDPLQASNWYSVPKEIVLATKGMKSVLPHFQGNYINALLKYFPDIGLDRHLFIEKEILLPPKPPPEKRDYRDEIKRRRKLFEEFAASMEFDPLIPRNWYNISLSTIPTFKKMPSVLLHYGGSPARALYNLFPEIGLDKKVLSKKRH